VTCFVFLFQAAGKECWWWAHFRRTTYVSVESWGRWRVLIRGIWIWQHKERTWNVAAEL